jgi:hypothetical protein
MSGQFKNFAFGFLAGVLLLYLGFWPETTKVERVVIQTETVEVDRIVLDTFFVTESPKATAAKASTDPAKYDSARTYTGSHRIEYGWLDWTATTAGSLSGLEIRPRLDIPLTTITRTTETTKTKEKRLRGLYAGASMGTNLAPGLPLTLQAGKTLISYEWQPTTGQQRLGVLIKLF